MITGGLHGGKTDGSVESGTIKVKKLIAGSIESDSLPVDKKPLAKRLADVNHIIGFGQSLMVSIHATPDHYCHSQCLPF
jgi:hypothetical protein